MGRDRNRNKRREKKGRVVDGKAARIKQQQRVNSAKRKARKSDGSRLTNREAVAEAKEVAAHVKREMDIPNIIDRALVRPIDSVLDFDGTEQRELLPSGDYLITARHLAIVPLAKYKLLIELAERGLRRQSAQAPVDQQRVLRVPPGIQIPGLRAK